MDDLEPVAACLFGGGQALVGRVHAGEEGVATYAGNGFCRQQGGPRGHFVLDSVGMPLQGPAFRLRCQQDRRVHKGQPAHLVMAPRVQP